jgi:hypothetical protein
MERRVLGPLGMSRTGFAARPPVVHGHEAQPGSREHRVAPSLPYPRARRSSGGLFSCAGDLLSFAAHLLGAPGPLAAASIRQMQTGRIETDPEGSYGLGLFVWRGRERPVVEHGGAVPGFATGLVLVPEEETALVVLTNSGRGQLVREDVLAAVGLGRRLPAERALPPEALEPLAGTFREPLGSEIVVGVRDGGLDLVARTRDEFSRETVEQAPLHLRPAAPEWFVARDGDDRGDSAEFLDGGRLLRFGWLFERVQG